MSKPWSFKLTVDGALVRGDEPVGLADVDWAYGVSRLVQNGSTTGTANYVSLTEDTIASGATLALDMTDFVSGGIIALGDGMAVTWSEVQAFVVVADPTNTTSVTIQKSGSNGWTGPVGSGSKALAAGESLIVLSKMTTSGTNKSIDLVNGSGAPATVKVLVVGKSP